MEWCLTSFTAILLVPLYVIPNSFFPCVWLSVSQRETGERICFNKKKSPNNLLEAVSILFEESLFFLLIPFLSYRQKDREEEKMMSVQSNKFIDTMSI